MDTMLLAAYGFAALAIVAVLVPVLLEVFFLPSVKPAKERESRLARFGDALSQVGNVLLFDGNQNHSISGDAFRYKRPRTLRIANWLFRDTNHCRRAHLKDIWLADRLISQTPSHLITEARQIFGREVG